MENINIKKCPVSKKCSGCQLSNMTYAQQLEWKQKEVAKLMDKYAPISPIIGMSYPYNYRNKVSAVFRLTQNKRIISGVYQSSTHGIVGVDKCLLNNKKADKIMATMRKLLREFRLLPYNENSGQGFLRHVLVKISSTTGQIMVVLVTGTPIFPKKKDFVRVLLEEHPDITTIIHNVNKAPDKMMLGESEKTLFGKGYIEDKLCGCTFRISSKSFYQVNSQQTEKLYKIAIEMADLKGNERLFDAYCGTGTIGLAASGNCKEIIGVELNGAAINDAIENAKINGIKNARFVKGDAGMFMQQMASEHEKADIVIMDPPRAGSSKEFLASLLKLSPQRIVYISCNPQTLARDVAFLDKKYKVEKIQPVDMFPHTNHVESVVLMSRVEK